MPLTYTYASNFSGNSNSLCTSSIAGKEVKMMKSLKNKWVSHPLQTHIFGVIFLSIFWPKEMMPSIFRCPNPRAYLSVNSPAVGLAKASSNNHECSYSQWLDSTRFWVKHKTQWAKEEVLRQVVCVVQATCFPEVGEKDIVAKTPKNMMEWDTLPSKMNRRIFNLWLKFLLKNFTTTNKTHILLTNNNKNIVLY